jgi:hypothetical protein
MNLNQKNKNFTFRGSSRDERTLKALMPEGILIDDREIHDWLAFLARAAQLVRFPNTDQQSSSATWANFLEKDPSVFLASILVERPENWDKAIRKTIRKYYASWGVGGKQKAFAELLYLTIDIAKRLNKWYCDAELLLQWEKESPVTTILEQAIQSELSAGLNKYKDFLKNLGYQNFIIISDLEKKLEGFHPIWKLDEPVLIEELDEEKKEELDEEKIKKLDEALEVLRKTFQRLQFTMTVVVGKAEGWFRDSLEHKNDHDPHIGLLLSFLQVFKHVRNQLNTYPLQHLHYYYFDQLEQQLSPLVPDQTTVCFQLAEQADTCRLEKGTLLLASVNEQGLPSHYATTTDIVLTQARIAALKTLYVSRYNVMGIESSYNLVNGIYVAPVANSRDGLGQAFSVEDKTWPVFGEEQLQKNISDRRMIDAEIGFVIAAPIFALSEGHREIDLVFQFTSDSFSHLFNLLADIERKSGKKANDVATQVFTKAFNVYATGVHGWFQITHLRLNSSDKWLEQDAITLTLILQQDDPAITDNKPELIGTAFDTDRPLIKILLNPDHATYLYSFTGPLQLASIGIEARVKGLKSLTLYNELGLLDGAAPFAPLGPLPKRNTYFLVGHAELFRKKLTDLSMYMEWNNLPDLQEGFAEYYQDYGAKIDNSSFQVRLSAISNHSFSPSEAEQQQVFDLFGSNGPKGRLSGNTDITTIDLNRLRLKVDYEMRTLPDYTSAIRSGYLKLQLCHPNMAFGHADYPRLFAEAMIAQSRPTGFMGRFGKKDQDTKLPREPYTPIISKLRVSYTANTVLNMRPLESGNNDMAAGEKVFCLHPFGQQEIFAQGKVVSPWLLPQYEEDGYLFIGLEAVKPGYAISMLFHIQESKQKMLSDALDIQWSYLHDNYWQPLGQEMLLADHTNRFSTTGIVQINIPIDISTHNSIMPPGLFWLRVSANGKLHIVGRILDIQMNAVGAIWINNGDENHFNTNMIRPSIKELVNQRPEIEKLIQPIAFFGGQPSEELSNFYVRISERLRHKNRAITQWDIEHLVLEKFPFVSGVKCVTSNEYHTILPGELIVIAIAQTEEKELQPMLGFHQLELIRNFLKEIISPFAQIKVINPVYEKIILHCTIRLAKGLENEEGLYNKRLQTELAQFICPWLIRGTMNLGLEISKNEVLSFINSRPYIKFVTRFSLIKIFETPNTQDIDLYGIKDTSGEMGTTEILKTELPWSVFVPVDQHNIEFTKEEKYIPPAAAAIEGMRLETGFMIVDDTAKLDTAPSPPPNDSTDEEWYIVLKSS